MTNREWDRVIFYVMPGDVVTSKKGFLIVNDSEELALEQFSTKKIKHIGNGVMEVIGEKRPEYVVPKKG